MGSGLSGFTLNERGIASARILPGVNLPGAAVAGRDQNERHVLHVLVNVPGEHDSLLAMFYMESSGSVLTDSSKKPQHT